MFNPNPQKEAFERLRLKFRLKQAKNKEPSINTWRHIKASSQPSQILFGLKNKHYNSNLSPSTISDNKFHDLVKSLNFKKEPTLEAVLNDFSRMRQKLPTIQPKIKKSVGDHLKHLPEQDRYSQILNFSGNLKHKGIFIFMIF